MLFVQLNQRLSGAIWSVSLSAMAIMLQAAGSAATEAGDAHKGRAVYERTCTACHGPQGRGDSQIGKMLVPPAPDLTSLAIRKKSDAEMLQVLANGKPPSAMPAFKGQLSEQEMRDTIAYLRTLTK
jgi:mono/diheme cytochrome c family protein